MPFNVCANITGTVWKIEVERGDLVQPGQTLIILESMKMELAIEAELSGYVSKIWVAEGQPVEQGQTLLTLA